jgi:hypothetical protein
MSTRIPLTVLALAVAALTGASVASAARLGEPAVGATGSLARLTPSHHVTAMEVRHTKQTGLARIEQLSVPLETRTDVGPERHTAQKPDGSKALVAGTAPSLRQNGLWAGTYDSNPNAQVGKLYFDTKPGPGESWSHCSATVINSENRSLVLTAGHCIYNPDPDGDGVIAGNGYWYENFQFCPGYEYGCKLGTWYPRTTGNSVWTTSSWYYGSGTRHWYDYKDDIGILLMAPSATKGNIVDAVGGQGILFNAGLGLSTTAFGYPVTDSRWPGYTYTGEDLDYCPGVPGYDGLGHLKLACTMTGGASGGPWIISPNGSWLGYVNSVNSHKPWGAKYMGGPYFGAAEQQLFNQTRAL